MLGLLKTTPRWTDTHSLAGRGSGREQLRASDPGDLNSPQPYLSCTEEPWSSSTHPRLTPFQRPQASGKGRALSTTEIFPRSWGYRQVRMSEDNTPSYLTAQPKNVLRMPVFGHLDRAKWDRRGTAGTEPR